MIRVGVVGLGTMGLTHLDVYTKRGDVQVVAIADSNPGRLNGTERATGNIQGQAQGGFDYASVRKYDEGMKLIRDKNVDLVDICLQTPLHAQYAIVALKKGRHVLMEKPAARTYREARRVAAVAEKSAGLSMCAMCMRFWPGWTFLKEAVDDARFGRVLAAQFRRVASHPGGVFYSDGARCGGALLDLHIHDTDFVHYLFGLPKSVSSFGYSKITDEPDHVVTRYEFDNVPLVVAEGGWAMGAGFGFQMQFAVNFERATLQFDLAAKEPLSLTEGGQRRVVPVEPAMGYEKEIAYFLDCIGRGVKPAAVTLEQAARSVAIVEAEARSIRTGRPVKVRV